MGELLQGHRDSRCCRTAVGSAPSSGSTHTAATSSVSLANQDDVAGSNRANRLGQFGGSLAGGSLFRHGPPDLPAGTMMQRLPRLLHRIQKEVEHHDVALSTTTRLAVVQHNQLYNTQIDFFHNGTATHWYVSRHPSLCPGLTRYSKPRPLVRSPPSSPYPANTTAVFVTCRKSFGPQSMSFQKW